MNTIIVLNDPKDWTLQVPNTEVISARAYLTDAQYAERKTARVFNLSRSYRYQSLGYYVSLLAEARGHRAFPSIATITDFKSPAIIRTISDELDTLIDRQLNHIKSDNFTLSIYFGQNLSPRYQRLCKQLYNLFPAPFLRAYFVRDGRWMLRNISPIALNEIPDTHHPYVTRFARTYFTQTRHQPTKISNPRYSLAILVDPNEQEPPSNKIALNKFMSIAESNNIQVELIDQEDYSRIAEFDALFIRTTTSVNHYTYRFSRRAFAEGLAVMDDPYSILKCANKVYLAEVLDRSQIPTPKTLIVDKTTSSEEIIDTLNFPCVLKKPDSSASKGVYKVTDRASLESTLKDMLQESDLVVVQEFLPTEFDWRIGILDRQPLYACKYFMANKHWQIFRWSRQGKARSFGQVEALPIYQVPDFIITTAIKAANLIGDGLYGVDLKQIDNKAYIIEVNDNPTIENRYEDQFLKDDLYRKIIDSFTRRVEKIAANDKLAI